MVIYQHDWNLKTETFFLITEIGCQGVMGKSWREMKWKLRIEKGQKKHPERIAEVHQQPMPET